MKTLRDLVTKTDIISITTRNVKKPVVKEAQDACGGKKKKKK